MTAAGSPQPITHRHRDQIDRLVGQPQRRVLIEPVSDFRHARNELIGEPVDRAIRREGDGRQAVRAGEPPMQLFARDLEDRLREVVVELQLVRPRRVVDRELAGPDDGLAPVLQHCTDAALAERNQDEILVGPRNPRRRAEHPLLA